MLSSLSGVVLFMARRALLWVVASSASVAISIWPAWREGIGLGDVKLLVSAVCGSGG
jgi:hypothetical protein